MDVAVAASASQPTLATLDTTATISPGCRSWESNNYSTKKNSRFRRKACWPGRISTKRLTGNPRWRRSCNSITLQLHIVSFWYLMQGYNFHPLNSYLAAYSYISYFKASHRYAMGETENINLKMECRIQLTTRDLVLLIKWRGVHPVDIVLLPNP